MDDCLLRAVFLINKSSSKFLAPFFTVTFLALVSAKMGWASFLAMFSRSHLVTRLRSHFAREIIEA
jgi:hypothetical protein